jgi:hypothetical protein
MLSFTSDRSERILRQLSNVIISALDTPHPQSKLLPCVLESLTRLEIRPKCLAEMAYEWCSVISRNRQSCEDWKSLVLCSLEIGFGHLDSSCQWSRSGLIHTEHHRELPEIVFGSKKSEAIEDLLQAWTMGDINGVCQVSALPGFCMGYIVGLHHLVPFSPRLRELVVRSVEIVGYKGFAEGGTEKFVELLNYLHVGVEDVHEPTKWVQILLDAFKSPEGIQSLSIQLWEFLVELAVGYSELFKGPVYSPQVTASLLEAREWEKLEYWMSFVWMAWPLQTDATIEDAMVQLFRQRPDAVQSLTQWMEEWSKAQDGEVTEEVVKEVPEAFKRICKQRHETA